MIDIQIPDQVTEFLSDFYVEADIRDRIPGTRQNFHKRKQTLRSRAGVRLLPGIWLYEKRATEEYLSQ